MFQQTIILGRLAKDPTVKHLENRDPIAKFTVVTSRQIYNSETQEWEDRSEFHMVSAFGKTAKTVEKFLKKGTLVYIVGRNKTSKYEKDGQTHWSTEVIVEQLKLFPKGMSKASDGEESSPEPAGDSPAPKPKAQPKPKSQPKQQRQEAPEPDYSDYSDVPPSDEPSDDNIPF